LSFKAFTAPLLPMLEGMRTALFVDSVYLLAIALKRGRFTPDPATIISFFFAVENCLQSDFIFGKFFSDVQPYDARSITKKKRLITLSKFTPQKSGCSAGLRLSDSCMPF
jgi:hypothetical protein